MPAHARGNPNMRVLLFNDNPVVTKLVTLSAQKTGDNLEVCSDTESLKSDEFDLLIVDDGLYNDETALTLGVSITASQHLFMANRGNDKPEGFEHVINKPFLPTDLVELFTMISNSLDTDESSDENDMIMSIEEDSLDLDSLEDDFILEEEIEDDLDDLDSLDFDESLEAENIEEETLELDESQESVLDKDDLAEVQSLLEDEDELLKDDISVDSLDNLDELGLDFDIEEDISDNLEEELSLDEDEEVEIMEEQETSLDDLDIDDSVIEEDTEEELGLDDIDEDELLALDLEEASEEIDEVLDDTALNELEDEIQSAISELSDEELEENVDEDILLDIVNSDDSLTTFSGLDDLDEQSLKVAVGEAEASEIEKPASVADEITENNEFDVLEKSSKVEGVEALKTLLKALENDNVVNSLKGMNININISFGDEN